MKRILDAAASLLLLPCCLPLLLMAATLIVLDSKGSPIYRQRRVGSGGRIFTLYKLRTMYSETETRSFKTEFEDIRVTAIGAFLRDTKIDELPQLWNVIRGEMSVIGPRPLSVEETDHLVSVEHFDRMTPGLSPLVRPGLTGLEQCTRSTFQPYAHRFQLNDYYERNLSLWLDLWIVKRTLFVCPVVCTLSVLSALLFVRVSALLLQLIQLSI